MENKDFGLGIDLGGTKVAGALFTEEGKASDVSVIYLQGRSGDAVTGLIVEMIHDFHKMVTSEGSRITSIGIAVPGIYYSTTGKVWAPNIPGWEDFDLQEQLQSHLNGLGIDLIIDSDRACYILGETWKGAAKGCNDAIFLAVGTGIGAGIITSGQVLRGANDIAGAIGWLAISSPFVGGYESHGCFEFHASGPGIARIARMKMKEENIGMPSIGNINPDNITAEHVFKAFHSGDLIARYVIDQAIEYWGKACSNLVSLFNPEKIVFGGGVFGPAQQFIDKIYEEAKKWSQPISIGLVEFEASAFGGEAGLYGAGFLSVRGKII